MKVAVIIVNYNDVEDTTNYVNKIREYKTIDRIVVVDNMSTTIGAFKDLIQLADEKVVVIRSNENGGYNYGNNYGIEYLESKNEKYDYIIISNPDIDVEEKAIIKSLEVLEKDEKVAVVAPRMYNKENKPIRRSAWKKRTFGLDVIHSTRLLEILFYNKLRNGEYSEEEYKQETLEVDCISGAFFIIRNTIFEEMGQFDYNVFLFYEEDILGHILKNLNYKTISLNTEKFIHFESQAIGKTLSYYRKVNQLYESKMYYHENYNNINGMQKFIFEFLDICRRAELLVEIPVRKLLKK